MPEYNNTDIRLLHIMATKRATRRRRAVESTDEPTTKVTSEMEELAVEFYKANKRANAEANKAKKARAELLKKMRESGVDGFEVKASIDDRDVILDSEIKAGRSTTVIDPSKFRSKVDDSIFMACSTIGVTKAKALCPTDVIAEVSTIKVGDSNVVVGPRK